MKKSMKTTFALVFTVILLAQTIVIPTYACTGVYVGKNASADGTSIVARSNDSQAVWPNYVDIVERVENKPGRTMAVDNGRTVFAELPATTYRYTATPWADTTTAENGLERDGAVCANEYGVSMTMSVTAFANSTALAADPLLDSGLTEFTANELVICQSKTAREAVGVLASLMDEYGSSECNIAIISDRTETWYVEMYTGHQYAAVKLPDDTVSVFGNEFNLVCLSDYEDSVISNDLETLPEKNGFAVYGDNGELDIMATYSMPFFDYSHLRTWMGHKILAPSEYGDYEEKTVYPLSFKADGKVSLTDVFEIIRNRYEGTEYCPDDTGRTDVRVIGTDTALSVHVLQTYPELPAEMSVVTWESTAPAVYGVFVPVASCSTGVSPYFGANQPVSEQGNFDMEHYAYYLFKGLNTLCVTNAEAYGRPVQGYWREAEKRMAEGMAEVLKTAAEKGSGKDAAKYVTSYCVSMQNAAFSDGQVIYNDVIRTMSKNSNTMRKGKNPETQEILSEDKPLTPVEVKEDLSVYGVVPEYTAEANNTLIAVAVCAAAAVIAAVCAGVSGKKESKPSRLSVS